jgi:hypothetical protein
MTWFGSFAHCKSLNRALDAGNISKALLCNASLAFETSYFWTGKIYESNIDTSADWTWQNGDLFKEWDKWKIIITDVGCSGCGFWKNGTIYLTSNCSQNFSYFCEGDRQCMSSFNGSSSGKFSKHNCLQHQHLEVALYQSGLF